MNPQHQKNCIYFVIKYYLGVGGTGDFMKKLPSATCVY